jgi:(1->4)-alpha-D-glucan 1-alpha-D-glucosylmutase
LQLSKDFTFDDTAAVVPYLGKLGISHLYSSPFLAARPGSTHGYDIIDHARLNPELGGNEAFERLTAALRTANIGLILDFVPNHMGIGFSDNAWWLDVLEWGQKSSRAASFDVDWNGLPYRQRPGVLLPILGRPYGEALENGEIVLKYDIEEGSFAAWYFDHKLPINPQRYDEILRTAVQTADGEDSVAGRDLLRLADQHSEPASPSYRAAVELKSQLAQVPGAADIIDRGLDAYSARQKQGTVLLHRLLERQNYHLAYWRVAFSAINYRRFFDINDLAGLRPENRATFRAMHVLVERLISEGKLQGLRLDHIDGLRDPAQYTQRLRELIRKTMPQPAAGTYYVVIEKILAEGETLPKLPGIAGTTGYERLNSMSRVLVDGHGLEPLQRTWQEFSGERAPFAEILTAAKLSVLETMLASEFTVLTRALARIAAGHFSSRDYTINRLRAALQEYVLQFPVYRTYIAGAGPTDNDRMLISVAIERARAEWQGPDRSIFDFIRDVVTTDLAGDAGYSAPRVRNFALKLQQFTGPLMAKSLEDTAFYRYHRLLALNEVGGDPSAPPLGIDEFHAEQKQFATTEPHGLTATETHDTKRGEDARMRILALAELHEEWSAAVERWKMENAGVTRRDGRRQITAAHEYMLYQTLIGAWPLQGVDSNFAERIEAYAVKAAREGKQQTSWTMPNEGYENELKKFVQAILERSPHFIEDFSAFALRAALIGALNSLSLLTLKVLLPGVPDFFQGTEYWDLSLVDPDNRRPVNFLKRRSELSSKTDWQSLVQKWPDGRIKFKLMRELLRIRRDFCDVLEQGDYRKVVVQGDAADRVIAFSRGKGRKRLIVLAARHFVQVTGGGREWPRWSGSLVLPGEAPTGNLLHDANPRAELAADLFGVLPVAVLQSN